MSETSQAQVCRLVVVGPTSRVDLSVPVHVPVADLLPALLRSLGTDLADRGLEHSGWVLQRLGEEPFDEDATTNDLDLVDGDVVHLRPRSEQIPPLDFDDLIDGIASGISARSGLWRTTTTRFVSLCALALWLVVAAAVPALPGPPGTRVLLAVAAGVILLGAAPLVAHVLADRRAAGLVAAAAVVFAVEAALVGGNTLGTADSGAGIGLLLAAVTGAVLGPAAALLVADRAQAAPVAVAALVVAAGAAVAAGVFLAGASWPQTATALVLLTVLLRPTVPLSAFKLAGMALPPLPVEPDDLQTDIDPQPGKEVLERTAAADHQMTALYLAYGLLSGTALVVMSLSTDLLVLLAAGCAALTQLLAVRPMTSAWHRLALGIPAFTGVVTGALALAARVPVASRSWILLVVLLFGVAAATAAHTLPRRRLTPMWGRVGDWAQSLGVVATMGLALGVWDVFALIRRTVS